MEIRVWRVALNTKELSLALRARDGLWYLRSLRCLLCGAWNLRCRDGHWFCGACDRCSDAMERADLEMEGEDE